MRYYPLSLLILIVLAGCRAPARRSFPTHLKDTTRATGRCIVFLRPDNQRFEAESPNDTNGDNAQLEADADFGVGIVGTQDSLRADSLRSGPYGSVHLIVSDKRYILISDCAGGPLLIDRDTVDYGVILSGPGEPLKTTFNSVHSGDYMSEVREYFGGR